MKKPQIPLIFILTLSLLLSSWVGAALDKSLPSEGLVDDSWFIVEINGERAGYAHQVIQRKGDTIETVLNQMMKVGRLGSEMKVVMVSETWETIDGKPLRFALNQQLGAMPQSIEGTVADGVLTLTQGQFGNEITREIPFSEGGLMGWGIYLSILDLEIKEGATRELLQYMPELNVERLVPITLTVESLDPIEWEGQVIDTWRMSYDIKVAQGAMIQMQMWVDDNGKIYRSVTNMMGMEIITTLSNAAAALKDFVGPELMDNTMVEVAGARGLENRDRARYQLQFSTDEVGDNIFPDTRDQKVIRREGKIWEIDVHPMVPGEPGAESLSASEREEYLEANLYLNYNDSEMVKVVESLAEWKDLPHPELADRLTEWVAEYVTAKNYDIGYATASQVVRQPEGDCTEHAVLLAALGRAMGIPSRAAFGMATLPPMGNFDTTLMGMHMWNQFWIDGQWYDYDAAIYPTQTQPLRILMATSSLRSDIIMDLTLAVMESISGMKVLILPEESD